MALYNIAWLFDTNVHLLPVSLKLHVENSEREKEGSHVV